MLKNLNDLDFLVFLIVLKLNFYLFKLLITLYSIFPLIKSINLVTVDKIHIKMYFNLSNLYYNFLMVLYLCH